MDRNITTLDVTEHGLVGKLFLPAEGDNLLPVIVLGGSGGGVREYEAGLLAESGFATLALKYFGGGELPWHLRHIPLEYFETAMHWLRSRPRCDADAGIGIVGSSRGAEAALLLGATYPEVRAVVAISPSSVVWGAAWTCSGVIVPFMCASIRHTVRAELLRLRRPRVPEVEIHRALLRDKAAVEHATIPVERINGPVLLISGGQDEIWPSSWFSERIMKRLREHEHPFSDEHLHYQESAHAYLPEDYNDAWSRAISFLRESLTERDEV